MRALVMLLILACASLANADTTIYKCERDGKITYSGTPCEGTTVKEIAPDKGSSAQNQAQVGMGLELVGAVKSGDEQRVRTLLANGADVRARDKNEITPLHWAAATGQVAIIELLIAKGADINAKSDEGVTPLYLAAMMNRAAAAEVLIARGAEINARTRSGYTALTIVAREGHRGAAELLIAHGADVNAKDTKGMTPLVWAVFGAVLVSPSGQTFVSISNPNLSAAEQREVLEKAREAKGQWREIAKLLINHKAQTNLGPNVDQPLYWAAFMGDGELVKELIDHGADINFAGGGETALHAAIAERHKDAAAVLINNGANVNAENRSGRTPLHFLAAHIDDGKLAELMIQHGANVNARDKDGTTPLTFAAKGRNSHVADVLQRNGGK